MSKYCPECGKENKDSAKFCLGCGEKFDQAGTLLINAPKVLDNRYEIICTVKSGAMGCVYKAKDTRLNNIVAVKQMLSSFTNPQEAAYVETRFAEEARILSALKHNGLPKVIDYFTEKEFSTGKVLHYLVMEFVEGKDLETVIQERGQKPFPVDEVLNYFRQILEIFDYLHTQKPPIVYRDLNPRNIMVQNGKLFLVDFGIAKVLTPQQKGTAIGTAGYAAPEQYKGAAEPRSDIYSLGALLHYLLTGKDPEDSSHGNLFSFERVRKINLAVPEYLDALIVSMVDIVIDKRPQNIEALKKALYDKPQPNTHSTPKPQVAPQMVKMVTQKTNLVIQASTSPKCSPQPSRITKAVPSKFTVNPKAIVIIIIVVGLAIISYFINFLYLQHYTNKYSNIFGAVRSNDIIAVKTIISLGANVNAKENDDVTPLHWAAWSGDIDVAVNTLCPVS